MAPRFLVAAALSCVMTACTPFSSEPDIGLRRVTAAEFEAAQEAEAQVRNEQLLNATVRVEIAGGGTGSGTVIGTRHVLTNHHVAGASGTHNIRAWLSQGGKLYPVTYQAKVVASDESRDLALLEIDGEWPGLVAPLGSAVLTAGTSVYVAGSPLGKRPHVVAGEVSLPRDDEEVIGLHHMMATAPVAPGNSGGGCWWRNPKTGRYELIAVTRALATVPIGFGASLLPHMSYFIPAAEVRAFLAKSGVAI